MKGQSLPVRTVCLLGALHIEDQRGVINIPSGNTQTLLSYLVLFPGKHTRERLADLFWPDAPPDRVGRYLSNLIYRLRQSLGETWLEIQDEYIALNTGQDLRVDVVEFESLLAGGDQEAIHRALALYHGDLLPEIYTDWILPRRVALREKYLVALSRLAQAAEDDHNIDKAFGYYHRLTTEDPLSEAACRGLMRVYTQMDRHAVALAEFERLSVLLNDELGVEPVAETCALAQSIRENYEARRTGEALRPSFVGRRQEYAALLRAVDNTCDGRGGLVLVEGEPGVGKTRLLEMVAEGAIWRGVNVAWGKATELSAVTPYAPLDEALQNAITGPRAARLQAQLSPPTVDALEAVAPSILGRQTTTHSKMSASVASPDLPAALYKGLTTLGEIAPLLVILDDVQWASPAFWNLLSFVPRLIRSAVLIVLSYRSETLRADPTAWSALRNIDLEMAPLRLQLSGLEKNACDDLARELGHTLSPEHLEAFHATTQGNPLYILEALSAKSKYSGLPPSLTRLIDHRLATLSVTGRSALEIAAVVGQEFSHGVWQAVGGRDVVTSIPELLAARLIEETPHGYRFQHDLTRQQIYKAIETERLQRLHCEIANVLAGERAAPEVLAWHYEQGASWEHAVHSHRRAGDRAVQAYAYQAALAHYDQGVALLTNLPDAPGDRLALLLRRQRVLRLLARLETWRRDVDEIEHLAAELGDTSALLEALEARLRLTNIASDMTALREAISRVVVLAPEAGDPALEALMLNTAGFYLSDSLGEHTEAMPLLRRSVELADTASDSSLVIEALCNLAFAQWATGNCQSAHESAARALAVAELRSGHFPARAHALASLGQVAMGLANWEQARTSLQKAIQLYEELSDNWNLGDPLYNFAIVTSAMGQHTEAIQAAERLLKLAQQAGVSPDSGLGIWYHALRLRVYTAAGDFDAAGRICSIIERGIDSMENGRALITALTAAGINYLAVDQLPKAVDRLSRAVRLWQPAQNFGDVVCALFHAIAAHRTGDFQAAQASYTLADAVLAKSDVRYHRVLCEYARYVVLGDEIALNAANAEIQRQAVAIENPDTRRSFLTEVRLHRTIESEIAKLPVGGATPGEAPGSQVFLLARCDAPLGKPLTDTEKVAVRWTLDAGEADAIILRQHGKAALRQHRIRRLLIEANTQGASPTDEDLARALGVNRRTILRDMTVLQASGEALPTRRRKWR